MIETNLIKALETKDNYFNYKELALNLFTEEKTKQILKDLEQWFEDRTEAKEVDWEDFSEWFLLVKHPMYKEEKKQIYRTIFEKVRTTKESTVVGDIINTFRTRSAAEEIAQIAGRIAEGQQEADIDEIYDIMEGYYEDCKKSSEEASPFVTTDTVELISHVVGQGGYNWRLNELNLSLGPIRKGDFMLIGARPECGKTTLLASEATFIAQQLKDEEIVLWVNNEEEGRKVMWRVKQACIGWTTRQMQNYPHKVSQEYEKLLGRQDKILVCDRTDMNNLKSIEKLLDEYNVGLLIIDQLRKVNTGTKSEGVQRLQELYTTARTWAKDYCPVITVHQARGDAEGLDYIAANQLEGCQTEIQGELDAQVMIGRVLDPQFEHVRYINIVKNKLAGGKDSDERYRHGRHQVKIVPEIGRYESYE